MNLPNFLAFNKLLNKNFLGSLYFTNLYKYFPPKNNSQCYKQLLQHIITICLLITLQSKFVFAHSEEKTKNTTQETILSKYIAQNYNEKLQKIDLSLQAAESIWLKRYENFKNYHAISNEIKKIENDALYAPLDSNQTHRLDTLKKQQILLEQYRDKPFGELLDKPIPDTPPTLTNPFGIFSALSYFKHISILQSNLQHSKNDLDKLLAHIQNKYDILYEATQNKKLSTAEQSHYRAALSNVQEQILELQSAKNILETTIDVFNKDTDEIKRNLEFQIKHQILKLIYIGIGVLVSIIVAFIFKMIAKRYIQDNERIYTTNKVINFFNITIIFMILLFTYIDNVTYAVALVGFASAGLAIAMKDMFMSILGWLVIVVGGSIHVGDRIRVRKDNETLIGDVLDISMLRITIYDDITLTSYQDNHRAGRLIFIPNNYIFTNLIANYTYGDLTNVWDNVNVCITFDSNIKKAKQIALEVAKKHAKPYTDQTRKQMEHMRDRFALANSALNVNPRVFNFIKNNGMEISVWFQNYAYGTLKLKSLIAQEIIEQYLQEEDIHIAYPITRLVYDETNGLGQIQVNHETKNLTDILKNRFNL